MVSLEMCKECDQHGRLMMDGTPIGVVTKSDTMVWLCHFLKAGLVSVSEFQTLETEVNGSNLLDPPSAVKMAAIIARPCCFDRQRVDAFLATIRAAT